MKNEQILKLLSTRDSMRRAVKNLDEAWNNGIEYGSIRHNTSKVLAPLRDAVEQLERLIGMNVHSDNIAKP